MNYSDNYLTAHPSQKGLFEIRLTTVIAMILIIFSAFYLVSCKDSILPKWITGPNKQELAVEVSDLKNQVKEVEQVNKDLNTQLDTQKDTEKINTDAIIEHTKTLTEVTVVAEKIKTTTKVNIKKIQEDPSISGADKKEQVLNEVLSGIGIAYNQLPVKEELDV